MANSSFPGKSTPNYSALHPEKIHLSLTNASTSNLESSSYYTKGDTPSEMFLTMKNRTEMWTKKRIVINTLLAFTLADLPDLTIPDPLSLDDFSMEINFPNKYHPIFDTVLVSCKENGLHIKLLKNGKNVRVYPFLKKDCSITFENSYLLSKEIRRLYRRNKDFSSFDEGSIITRMEELKNPGSLDDIII